MQTASTTRFGWLTSGFVLCLLLSPGDIAACAATEDDEPSDADMLALGKQLFEHEWQPNDPRSHAGDGLGPLFNGRSCSGCHVLGGLGGAGPAGKNVETLTAQSTAGRINRKAGTNDESLKRASDVLARVHPGLATAPSVVLHLAGTDPSYSLWRDRMAMLARSGRITGSAIRNASREARADARDLEFKLMEADISLGITQRNTTAVFGAGLIDSISEEAIVAAAAIENSDFPKVHGRVARLPDGRIGRFGWKAQIASLDDFTRAACAMEIGLEVPGRHQSPPIGDSDYAAPGLDLSEHDVQSLVRFVRTLPAPTQKLLESKKPDPSIDRTIELASLIEFLRDPNPSYRRAAAKEIERRGEEAHEALPALHQAILDGNPGVVDAAGRALVAIDPINSGRQLFSQLGCAVCHVPKLGNVEGIYSDLLLHDMGDSLADVALYYGTMPIPSSGDRSPSAEQSTAGGDRAATGDKPEMRSPIAQEWRTPPLWGCSESAPYLHDGRAANLEVAILQHGGEAAESSHRFSRLSAGQRLLLVSYLKSLGAK
jgi:CxxC motif-containing protein (DUF1111 family)